MSEKIPSQVRDVQNSWKKAMEEQLARMELAYGEVSRMQEKNLEQSRHAVDEMAKLTKDSFNYVGQLSTEWCKLTLEATKKATDFFTMQG